MNPSDARNPAGKPDRRPHRALRTSGWLVAAALLLVPAVAMRFTPEVNWGPGDFVVFGILLLVTGLALELALRLVHRPAFRILAAVAVLSLFLWVWAELAVGVWFH